MEGPGKFTGQNKVAGAGNWRRENRHRWACPSSTADPSCETPASVIDPWNSETEPEDMLRMAELCYYCQVTQSEVNTSNWLLLRSSQFFPSPVNTNCRTGWAALKFGTQFRKMQHFAMSFSIPYYRLVRQSWGGRAHKTLGMLSCSNTSYLRLSMRLHVTSSTRITFLPNAVQQHINQWKWE